MTPNLSDKTTSLDFQAIGPACLLCSGKGTKKKCCKKYKKGKQCKRCPKRLEAE